MNALEKTIKYLKKNVANTLLTAQENGNILLDGHEIDEELVATVLAECLSNGYAPDVMSKEDVIGCFERVYHH